MNQPAFQKLRTDLESLVSCGILSSLKTGTEVEDMSFEDIRILRALSLDIVPLYVKIGGPEARNDIRELMEIGVDGIIAPMIESPYALKNFIQTMKELLPPHEYSCIEKGINLETITGYQNMNAILGSAEARELSQITAARSDLSGSMELPADDDRVMEMCAVIVARARENDLRTSVGGGIHSGIVHKIIDEVNPDTINTRHMVMNCSIMNGSAGQIVNRCLAFEVSLYSYLASMPGGRKEIYASRAAVLHARIQKEQAAANEYVTDSASIILHHLA